MTELDYFCTKHELVAVLEQALRSGFHIKVKAQRDAPIPIICRSVADIQDTVNRGSASFLLEREDFTRYPLEMIEGKRKESRFWYFRAKEGGPVIELYFFAPYVKDGTRYIPCSLLSYHDKIVNPSNGQIEAAGAEVRRVFSSLAEPLKASSRRISSLKRAAFVSPGVDHELTTGCLLAKPFNVLHNGSTQ